MARIRFASKTLRGWHVFAVRNHWDALCVYVTDGRLPIDNNQVERLMKRIAIGRKNWLFIGSVRAG
ncbi:MAG: transposase, partial [Planctomycetota bacterium]